MSGENVFNFIGKNIESGYFDHVFFAVYDLEKSILIHATNVTGLEPTSGVKHRCIILFPVSVHNLWSTRTDFSRFSLGKLNSVVIKDSNFRAGHRYADSSAFMVSIQGIATQNRGGFA